MAPAGAMKKTQATSSGADTSSPAPTISVSERVSSAARDAADVSAAEQVTATQEISDPDDDSTPSVTQSEDDVHSDRGDAPQARPVGTDVVSGATTWVRSAWKRTRERMSDEREKAAERAKKRAEAKAEKAAAAKDAADQLLTAAADATPRGAVSMSGLRKEFGDTVAVTSIDLDIPSGSFYGIVGPNGAGKTTTLSMITGLLRPDAGTVSVGGVDVWSDPAAAKRMMGTLPDRMRLFDRLTGAQLLYYSGVLRGLDNVTVRARVKSLTRAFGLDDAVGRLVSDYSAGMSKKIALACALIHSPRVLVLDEPFESVDPVSAASITEILQKYVENGGTVILSSHGMEFIERVCDNVAIIVGGELLASGAVDDVRDGGTLEERFIELVGGRKATEDLEWLHSFSD
ncbi:ABC-2 type transport system ATP-binding protein [Paramicrobacterium agarici]|uniref:ABC-2 type transport system ATP-binding protein n=2 Tax=Paramicrobacterium agarici TaxID=630514 RepID=A0A2A9DYF4_9MICO|nr:ABC-2 type transport system ATP-binding protein [Microbacterium agarici]